MRAARGGKEEREGLEPLLPCLVLATRALVAPAHLDVPDILAVKQTLDERVKVSEIDGMVVKTFGNGAAYEGTDNTICFTLPTIGQDGPGRLTGRLATWHNNHVSLP